MGINLPGSESAVSHAMNQVRHITYDPNRYPLSQIPLYNSRFLIDIKARFGAGEYSAKSLTDLLQEFAAASSETLAVNTHLYQLADSLLDELSHTADTMQEDQLEALRLNVLTFIHIYLNEQIVEDPAACGLKAQVIDLINLVANKDRKLYSAIKRLFGLYTRVGTIVEHITIFDTVTVPIIVDVDAEL